MSTFPLTYERASLPPNTIVPESHELFIPYFNYVYQDIANAVNNKDFNQYTIAVTSTPTNIPNIDNFGAYIVCVSGKLTDLPTLTASLCKSSSTGAGSIVTLGSQVGTGVWAAFALTISSTASAFQISHNNAGVSGNFNIRVIGTQ